jgi:hypothetical protein
MQPKWKLHCELRQELQTVYQHLEISLYDCKGVRRLRKVQDEVEWSYYSYERWPNPSMSWYTIPLRFSQFIELEDGSGKPLRVARYIRHHHVKWLISSADFV